MSTNAIIDTYQDVNQAEKLLSNSDILFNPDIMISFKFFPLRAENDSSESIYTIDIIN